MCRHMDNRLNDVSARGRDSESHISLSICAEVSTGITPSLFGGRLRGKLAAIDEQGVPGDEGGFIRSKKFHCSCNLVGLANSPNRNPASESAEHTGVQRPGRDGTRNIEGMSGWRQSLIEEEHRKVAEVEQSRFDSFALLKMLKNPLRRFFRKPPLTRRVAHTAWRSCLCWQCSVPGHCRKHAAL